MSGQNPIRSSLILRPKLTFPDPPKTMVLRPALVVHSAGTLLDLKAAVCPAPDFLWCMLRIIQRQRTCSRTRSTLLYLNLQAKLEVCRKGVLKIDCCPPCVRGRETRRENNPLPYETLYPDLTNTSAATWAHRGRHDYD